MTLPTDPLFESRRRPLRALAYRMLGSRSEAEDVVQDCWLRWQAARAQPGAAPIEEPAAWLSRVATNLCLDRLQSARARREHYVGVWLPEPLVDADTAEVDPGPEARSEYAQDVSIAFLLVLERLTPLERAAFLLHDVFDLGFDEVAAACRQLARRARAHVQAAQARVDVRDEEALGLLAAFARALRSGDVEALATLLADDAQMLSDGGGQVAAVPRPVRGAARVAQVMAGFARLWNPATQPVAAARINGLPGVVMRDLRGHALQTMAFALSRHADGRACVAEIYVVRNPDKLAHVREPQEQP
jgi:RNA polymerase sigma-70 factor (ECF subfamily)